MSTIQPQEMSSSFFVSMYLYLGEGTIIIFTNSILVYSILGKKKNRERREFLLIVSQALADTIYAIAFMLIAVHRLNLAATGRENGTSTVWECALKPALPLHNWATPLLGLLPLTTSLNFLVCSVFPLWYMRARWVYTSILLACPHLVSLFLSVANYILLWGDMSPTTAQCVAAKGAAHHIAYGGMLSMRMLANLASAIIYAGIILYLRKSQKLQELTAHQRKTHRNAAITLGFVTLNSMALLFIPDVLLFFNPANITLNYSTLLYSMTLSKTTINFFIYMWRYGELADMVTSTTCRRVPRLKKYFPERSQGFRSSQVGDTSMARLSTQRKNSFVDRIGARGGRNRVSPKGLEIPTWKQPSTPNETPWARRISRPKEDESPAPEGKDSPSPSSVNSPEPRPEEIDRTSSVNSPEAPVESSKEDFPKEVSHDAELTSSSLPTSFLPPIDLHSRSVDKTSPLDNRSFWSNY